MADAPESTTDEKSETKEPSGFWKFWTTLPGVLTGIAAVVAAVVSLIALFHHGPGATTAAADPPAAASRSNSSVGTSADVLSQGSLTMGVNEHVDLAAGVVSDSGSANRHNPQFFLGDNSGYQLVTDAGRALVAVDGTPDRATCLAAVTARQAGTLALTAAVTGKTICVLTDSEQVAALSNTTLPAVGAPRFGFDYVLWS